MGFTPTFYAGRPKLSEITIDSDLDMGGRNILRARIGSPYMPETWPTEELDWGDTDETVQTLASQHGARSPEVLFSAIAGSETTKWVLQITPINEAQLDSPVIQILANDEEILNTGPLTKTQSHEITFYAPANASIVVNHMAAGSSASFIAAGATLRDTGIVAGPKTFNLTGKWLALGIDMKGLAATVKINGVEMPYSDYPLYFPIAPTELSIPGEWDASQIRPIVEVYV